MAKYYALIREIDPSVEDHNFKFTCEVVGWQDASGWGGDTIEACIASAKESILHFKEEGTVFVPNIKVVEFDVDV